MRAIALLILPLLTGCVGSVTLDITAEDDFAVNSATWFEVDTDDGAEHMLAVTNRGDTCEAVQEFFPSAVSRINEWFSDGADCSDGEELFGILGTESAEIWAEDDQWMRIFLNEGSSQNARPETQDYESAGDPGWEMSMGWYRKNTFDDAADNVDDACIFGTAGLVFLEVDPYRTRLTEEVGGDLELTVEDDTVTAVGTVELLDEDDEDAGDVEFEFTATHCPVDLSGNDIIFLP